MTGTCRWRLLAGASVLVLAATGAGVPRAEAQCAGISSDTTVSSSTGCTSWSGGNLSITGAGTIAATGSTQPALDASGSHGSLVNEGTIDSQFIGLNNRVGGSIGTLNNSGTIRGDNGASGNGFSSAGINNNGTIGTLINDANAVIAGGSGGSDDTGIANIGGSIGTLTNNGTIMSAGSGIQSGPGSSIGTLTNNGTISGGTQDGVVVYQGTIGTLINNSGALIHGNDDAGVLVVEGGIGVVTNAGTISSANVAFKNSTNSNIDTLTNSGTIISQGDGLVNDRDDGLRSTIGSLANSGLIQAGNTGIENGGNIGTLTNSGSIVSNRSGIYNGGSIGALTNTGRVQSSDYAGVVNDDTIGTLTNSGTIVSSNESGVTNWGSITEFTNSSGGLIASGSRTDIDIYGVRNVGSIGTLSNAGTISGSEDAIYNGGGTIGTLTNSGTLSTQDDGIDNDGGSIGRLINTGVLNAVGDGIENSGTITVLQNATTISGGDEGVDNRGVIGALVNTDLIAGADVGLYNGSAGSIGSLSNNGTIRGTNFAINNNGGTFGPILNNGLIDGRFNNSGVIDGAASVGIDNTAAGTIGTLTNSGTITSGGDSGLRNLGSIGHLVNSAGGVIETQQYGWSASGLVNEKHIGTLTNDGIINARVFALNNTATGTIGTLVNNGTISSSTEQAALVSAGTISRLVNAGTITGVDQGLQNGGTIDALDNTGRIDGYTGVYNLRTIGTLTNRGTISGTYGVYNDRDIGVLTNSGAIRTGDRAGIFNLGSIGVVNNSGTIASATHMGLRNMGTIAALANSGTITGDILAILNEGSGTLGAITNSGVIAGNIVNQAASDLTIAGGDADHMGTLTGRSGGIGAADKGTIVNTASDVVFSSGHLLLNDDINATGRAVRNTGATLRLDNAVNITGNYRQTGGGLLVTAINNGASYGHLVVSGDAAVANSTVTISGAGLTLGQSYTIVDAAGTGTYADNTAKVAVTNGLKAVVKTVDNDLVVTLENDAANTYTSKGASVGGVGTPVGGVLDKIRTDGTGPAKAFQDTVLAALDALPEASQGEAIKQLAPVQNSPAAQMSNSATTAVLGAVEQHQQTAMAYAPETGVAAGADAHDTALWGEFLGGGAIRGSTAEADGYKTRLFGMAVGLDSRFTPNAMAGVALSWVRAWSHGQDNSSGSETTLDSYQLTFYGTYRLDRAFVDGQLGAGWNQFDQKRAISFLGSEASADYSGQQYVAKVKAGYDLSVGDTLVTPMAGLTWSRAVHEAYEEQGAGAANLSVDGRGVNTVSHDLGAKLSWTIPTSFGEFKPEVRAAWVHDYTKGPVATSGLMGGQTFVTNTPRTQPDGVRVGLATTFNGTDEMSLRAEYEGEMRPHYQSHTGLLKAIWGF